MKSYVVLLGFLGIALVGCGKPTADEYFDRGRLAFEDAQKVADSLGRAANLDELLREPIRIFTELREAYPGTEQAGEALFMLATIRNNTLHDIPTAIDLYRQYVSENPDGPKAPVALFMMGYLYNNELHTLDSAAAAYRRFLERFPNHELALSAQFELSSLGKSPEDLLPRNDVAAQQAPARSKARQRSSQ